MKKVITYGTFDLLHKGHINILKRAKELGDYLIVAISSDEFNLLKNKKSFYSFEERKYILEAIKYVDEIIPENNWEQKKEDIKKFNIDIFVMGDDWKGKFDELKEFCEVVYLPRTPEISTTSLKSRLKSITSEQIENIEKVLESIEDFNKLF
ncbi:glycerol-3-phosphate cytidylyltransferase [Candidatus Gracilibacteria bacterium]|nr:glycerol-3-phosphate cytidylyltransferase [Candidatus Gracilibacteria bacterium]